MLAFRLDPDLEKRLEHLAKKTGQTKTFHAREAIREYLGELEDTYLAVQRVQHPGKTYSAEEAKRELDL